MQVTVFGAAGGTGRHVVDEALAAGQEHAIMTSGLDWTIARCVGLTDDPATGEVHVLTEGKVGGSRVARTDVARWLVANLEDVTYSRQAVSLW